METRLWHHAVVGLACHVSVCVDLLHVCFVACWGSFDAFRSWVPVCWAHLAILLSELEGIDQAEGLVNATADWEVVDCDLWCRMLTNADSWVDGDI